jgi:hypothetical protein
MNIAVDKELILRGQASAFPGGLFLIKLTYAMANW